MDSRKSATVVGLGYIGLPLAAILAHAGWRVNGVDVMPHVVASIEKGRTHFSEPGLDELVGRVVRNGDLTSTTHMVAGDVFVVAVPTPHLADHSADLQHVMAALRAIAPHLSRGNTIIIESTCSVGTTEQARDFLANLRPDLEFAYDLDDEPDVHIAYCPERIVPGKTLHEIVDNDRSIGGISTKCSQAAFNFYSTFTRGGLHMTTARTAEFVKLAENAFRDVNIAFANEMSLMCEAQGIDVWEAINLANRHPRVDILRPGPGVGGHCIAVDPWFLISQMPDQATLLSAARKVNLRKTDEVLAKILRACDGFDQPRVACLGLTYKPNVDDLRESPALQIAEAVAGQSHIQLSVIEPYLDELPASLAQRDNVRKTDLEGGLRSADIVVALVEHRDFAGIDRDLLSEVTVIDAVGLFL